jgi:hypothetical protein
VTQAVSIFTGILDMIRVKKPQDLGAAVLFILLGSLCLWVGRDYSYGSLARMGPGFFPITLSWLLIGFGLLIGALACSFNPGPEIARTNWRGLLVIVVGIILFGFLIDSAGLLVTAFVVPLVAGFASNEVRWKEIAILSAILAVACVVVFVYGLRQPIPVFFGEY